MKVLNHKSAGGANNKRSDSDGVVANLGFHFGQIRAKRFEPKSAELSGLAAAGSRRLAWANLHLVAEFVASELAGMHGSGVVPTWGNSSPRADSLRCGDDGQGIPNIDIDNLVPTNGDRSEWVCHHNTFIEDFNLGVNENQVRANARSGGPQRSRQRQDKFLREPKSHREKQAQREDNSSQNITASRSKDLFISHVSIIAGEK
jgi:hypothetical protein